MKNRIGKNRLRFKDDVGNHYPEWTENEFGTIGDIVGGGTPETSKAEYWGGDILWFTPTEIKSKYIDKSNRTITRQGLKNSSAKILPKGTLLLSSRATVGDIGIALNECSTNQGFQSIVVGDNNVSEFIYYWILHNKKEFIRKASGSTFLEISKTEIAKLKILLPSKEEQQKIASFLSAIDEKISIIEKELEELKAYKKGVMQALFAIDAMATERRSDGATERRSDGATERRLKIWDRQGTKKYAFLCFKDDDGNNYPTWEIKKLGDVAKIYDGTHMTPSYQEKGVSFYSVEHVTANNFSVTKFISREVYDKENKRVKLEKGDILMTRIGDIGTSKYIHWDVEASFYVSLALIKNNSSICNLYLDQYIKSAGFQHELHKRTIHVAFPKKINLGEIGECMIEIPVLEEQEKIANFLTAIDDKINLVIEQQQQTQQFKKGLLQQMFN